MFSLKLFMLSFLLFSSILYTKAKTSKKVKHIQWILKYSGWKHLNDVKSISYYQKKFDLHSLFEIPKTYLECDKKIRNMTIYLACTYAKVLKNFSSVIIHTQKICKNKFQEKDIISGCICTEELVNMISIFIVPMITLMKSAIDALDLLHKKPWVTGDRNNLIISILLEIIPNIIDKFNKQTLSRNEMSTYYQTLKIVKSYFKTIIIRNVNEGRNVHCEYVPYDTNYLWNEWVQEYNDIIDKDIKLSFFKFLNRKIMVYIRSVIIEKYFQLGFKFDPITEETFVPIGPTELELEFKAIDEEPSTPIQIENYKLL
ncbi:uncharacterized protein LOC126906744 [Daktulosphaira vitifoliae]|uniref:uncharacterized protein LOC126906744 n=1 Tax=Daktulosphaira vitifoliae TaxID=58002 RepID=UPI0021AA1B31|nr:uncharacterized protein LOC126906744 [Daktulosphaira vitifoliae]